MGRLFGVLKAVKRLAEDYVCTIAISFICVALIFSVPQVRYAFDPQNYQATRIASITIVVCFATYFALSLAGVLNGERFYRRRRRQLAASTAGKPMLGPAQWLVTWPNLLAMRLSGSRRRILGLLLILAAIGLAATASIGATTPSSIPLLELTAVNLAWTAAMVGLWLTIIRTDAWNQHDRPALSQVIGWRIGWLCTTCLLGEIVWLVASLRLTPYTGYLMYTQWAVLQVLSFMLITAHTIDYWDGRTEFPLRIGCSIVLLGILLYGLLPERVHTDVVASSEQASDQTGSSRADDSPWIRQLERRVDAVPVGPCIIVASSGGGSRAALFSTLVLRGMANDESFAEHTYADHLVLASCVSGGSLATACTLSRPDSTEAPSPAKNTDPAELRHFVRQALLEEQSDFQRPEIRDAIKDNEQDVLQQLELRLQVLQQRIEQIETDSLEDDAWTLEDPLIDDVCTDFMAPILRGAITPFVSRGEALRLFWESYFGWQGINNVQGIATPESESEDLPPGPLVFFNACNTTWGTRYAIGFPALPRRFFLDGGGENGRSRFPVRSLSDSTPMVVLPLSHAVRLSSNFPWGFRVRSLGETNLLDGGMVDNTGIDTLFELFVRLSQSDEGQRVMAKMARKGVFILEIDSGGKPTGRVSLDPYEAGLLEPLQTMTNALHTNAEVVKAHYLHEIEYMLQRALETDIRNVDVNGVLADAGYAIPELVAHVYFQCEDFGGSAIKPSTHRSVMTAWALDPAQKGRVIARFLVELSMFRKTIDTHRVKLISDLAALSDLDELIATDRLERESSQLAELSEPDNRQAAQEFSKQVQQVQLANDSYLKLNRQRRAVERPLPGVQMRRPADLATTRVIAESEQVPTDDVPQRQFSRMQVQAKTAADQLADKKQAIYSRLRAKQQWDHGIGSLQQQLDSKRALSERVLK